MNRRISEGKRRVFGWLGKVLCAALLVLGFSAGAFAYQSACLYYEGCPWEWDPVIGGSVQYAQYTWDGSHMNIGAADQFPGHPPVGSLGACVFNGVVYCFFTTTDNNGTLWYVTVDPDNGHAETGPTAIASVLNPGSGETGTAAAVCGGQIWVFVAGFPSVFFTADGKDWSTGSYEWDEMPVPEQMLGAVSFYPVDDNPAAIMLIYNDTNNALSSAIFYPPDQTPHSIVTLPWPPVTPYLWQPVSQGNLLLGTSAGFNNFPAGAKAPCIQFYGLTAQGQDGIHQGRWEYNMANRSWAFNDITSPNTTHLNAWPWFDTVDSGKGTMRLSHILAYSNNQNTTFFINPSDWMVPQYSDNSYAGKATNTASSGGGDLQNLWTLVGVVLGPPPFVMNGATNACATADDRFSWVSYGKDVSTSVSTTSKSESTISVGANETIKGGMGELSLDFSYAHGWTNSNGATKTVSVSQNYQFDTCAEENNPGLLGWAIFDAPTLMTQWYKLYAYDNATYLNQDLYATSTGAVVRQTAYFELADPSQGNYPDLFAGMSAFPNSTDVAGWHINIPDWDNGGSDWTAIFGDTTNPPMPVLTLGQEEDVAYTQSETTIQSSENSNSFDVSAGTQLGNEILGFSAGVTVGYDTKFTTSTENESTITQNVTCGLNLAAPPLNHAGYVNQLTVQPYWLQATGTGTSNAPWLPASCGLDLPWCITWQVSQYQMESGATAGLSAAPDSTLGTILHGDDQKNDTYTLTGGRLVWLNTDGTETPIPITADEFASSKSATVSLNGHIFSSDSSKGKWSRSGDVWTYKSRQNATNDPFTLCLDFASATWSFDASSKTLDQEVEGADQELQVRIDVAGMHEFATWLTHDVDATWSHSEKKSAWQPYGVHEIKGAYNSQAGVGNLTLKGHVPKDTTEFGDVEIRVNGTSAHFPLLSTDGFIRALKKGRKVSYQDGGLSFDIDFSKGKWTAIIQGDQFKAGMSPKSGALRVQLLVGGKQLNDQTLVLQTSATTLMYGESGTTWKNSIIDRLLKGK
jgi:hypothetical protein